MAFKIGTYSIKLKTYNNKDLGLDNEYQNLEFQLFQKVFHVLFIPVIPVEKFWKVKNSLTNKEEPTTAELRTVLNLKELKRKSPFWTYSGLIFISLAVLFLIGFLISPYVEDGIESLNESNEKRKYVSETADIIENPKTNDLYHIEMIELTPTTENKKGYKRGAKKYLEYTILKFSNDSLELKLKENRYSSNKVILKEKIKLAKKDLINAVKGFERLKIYDKIQEFKETEAVFKLDEIER